MSHIAVSLFMFRHSGTMANETHRRRSDQSRSGRAVIFVQIISWCAVGALLILRGVATLTGDELFYDTDNRTTSVQMTTREPSDTKKSRAFDENEGRFILRVFRSW